MNGMLEQGVWDKVVNLTLLVERLDNYQSEQS